MLNSRAHRLYSLTRSGSGGGGGGGVSLDGYFDGTMTDFYSKDEIVRQYACYYNSDMLSVNLPNATSIGKYAFYYCSKLAEVNIPKATSIGDYAFESCTSITTADFPNATSVGNNGFYYCSRLKTANLPNVTSLGEKNFYYCMNLETINIPNATAIGKNTFYYCSSLITADFFNLTSIDTYAFYQCTIKALVLRSGNVPSLKNTNAFMSTRIATGTGYIYVPAASLSDFQSAANWSTYAAQFRALEDYTVDGTTTGALDLTKI